jgi:hypothetical protein
VGLYPVPRHVGADESHIEEVLTASNGEPLDDKVSFQAKLHDCRSHWVCRWRSWLAMELPYDSHPTCDATVQIVRFNDTSALSRDEKQRRDKGTSNTEPLGGSRHIRRSMSAQS